MSKPVFGVYDQVRLKPACSATETSWTLDILSIASIGNDLRLWFSNMCKTDFLMMWLS